MMGFATPLPANNENQRFVRIQLAFWRRKNARPTRETPRNSEREGSGAPIIPSIAARYAPRDRRPKGSSLMQDILNDRRLLKPQVRRPGSDHWEDIGWDQAIDEVARHIKKTRDETFIATDAQGSHKHYN
jgi:anaerobic selenocysteine-containing dehydrogenase